MIKKAQNTERQMIKDIVNIFSKNTLNSQNS